ncbi:MAG TPA: hypothetical protein VIG71_11400 [Enteractinococcus sp.]
MDYTIGVTSRWFGSVHTSIVVIYATRTHSLTMEKPPNNDHDTTDRNGE